MRLFQKTTWGNNVVINIHVHVQDGQMLPDTWFEMVKRKLLGSITSHNTASEMWDKYDKKIIYIEGKGKPK